MAKEVIISCSGGRHLGKKIARGLRGKHCKLVVERFPDSEIKVMIPHDIRGKEVYFVQSFYETKLGDINDKLIEVLFAGYTARELGAKKVSLIAPHIAYLRQDVAFKKGEAVANKILAKVFKVFDRIYVVGPHLHRLHSFKEFFPNAVKVSLDEEIAKFIKRRVGGCILVGPDSESEQWVKPVAKKLGIKYVILSKERFSSQKVKISGKKIKEKKIVIVDDIISTGRTLIEAAKLVKGKIYFIAAHGLFADNALKDLKKIGKVFVSNSVPSRVSKINCVEAIVEVIK